MANPITIRVTHPLRNPTMGMQEGDELLLEVVTDDTTPVDPTLLGGTYKIENVHEASMDLVEQQ
jgi:hypothetical protein